MRVIAATQQDNPDIVFQVETGGYTKIHVDTLVELLKSSGYEVEEVEPA